MLLKHDELARLTVGMGTTGVIIWLVGMVLEGSIGSTATGGVIIWLGGMMFVGSIGDPLRKLLGVSRFGIRSKLGRNRR
jgi:hypothetical protein